MNVSADRNCRAPVNNTTYIAPTVYENTVGSHREEILDEALEETFPASDPISPAISDVRAPAA